MSFERRQLLRILSFACGSSLIFSRQQLGISSQSPVQPASAPSPQPSDGTQGLTGGTQMEKVTGIGGLFFRAHDPKALARWYQEHLGIALTPTSHEDTVWRQEAGPTVFSPFPENTSYFGDMHKAWMVNFRVRDLEKMAAQLRASGIEVKMDPQSSPSIGWFARIHDPEGNPIELWQEAKEPAAKQ